MAALAQLVTPPPVAALLEGELPLRWDVNASLWNFSWSPRTPLHGMVIVTNYRIIFQPNDATQAFLDSGRGPAGPPWPHSSETDSLARISATFDPRTVPLTSILSCVRYLPGSGVSFEIFTRVWPVDMRQLRYLVSDANVAGMLAALDVHAFPLRATDLFAFDFRPAALAAVPAALQQSKLYSPADELVRLKLDDNSQWVVRTWNGDFGISPTYDRELIVPAAVTESTLREAAALRVGGRVPVLCWRSQQTGSLLLRTADLLRTPQPEGEPPRMAGATAAYMGILFQAVAKSVESCRQHRQRLAAQAAAAGVATGESDDEEEELSPDEPLAAVREHLRTLRSSLPTALNSPARAGRNTAASLAKQAKAAGRGRGAAAGPGSPARTGVHSPPTGSPGSPAPRAAQQQPGPVGTMNRSPSFAAAPPGAPPLKTLVLGEPMVDPAYKGPPMGPGGPIIATPYVEAVRWAHRRMQLLCFSLEDDASWLDSLEQTRWLEAVQQALRSSARVAEELELGRRSVMLTETRGPGRVCLIASLVQVLVDPFYGTIAGFMQLIQKEWINGGFNFARATGKYVTNMGVRPPDDVSGEEDPTFALFLDAVFQLVRLNPSSFEYNDTFLAFISDHVHSGVFGTFAAESPKDRQDLELDTNTPSLWSYITFVIAKDPTQPIFNSLYIPPPPGRITSLVPSVLYQQEVWDTLYLRSTIDHRERRLVEEADVALLKKLRLAQDRFERVVVPHRKHFGEQPVNQLGHHRRSLAAVPASRAAGAAGSAGPARK